MNHIKAFKSTYLIVQTPTKGDISVYVYSHGITLILKSSHSSSYSIKNLSAALFWRNAFGLHRVLNRSDTEIYLIN